MTTEEKDRCRMTENEILRDDFAGRAMQFILAQVASHHLNESDIAKLSYDIAESMIDERNKRLTK